MDRNGSAGRGSKVRCYAAEKAKDAMLVEKTVAAKGEKASRGGGRTVREYNRSHSIVIQIFPKMPFRQSRRRVSRIRVYQKETLRECVRMYLTV